MSTMIARVRDRRLVIDEPTDLPEGTLVRVHIVDEGDSLDDAERRALDDALEVAAASVEHGEAIPAEDVIRRLDLGA
jgi:hypothetical protein